MPTMTSVAAAVLAVAAGLSGGGNSAPVPLRFASPTNKYPIGIITSGGTKTVVRTRVPVVAGSGNWSTLCVGFCTTYVQSTTTLGNLGNDVLMVKCAIGLDGETVGYPITFSASRSATITNGTHKFISDEFTPSLFASLTGQPSFTRGQKFWIQWDWSNTAGQFFPRSSMTYASYTGGALSILMDPATFDGTFAVDNFATRTTGSTGSGGVQWTNSTQVFTPWLIGRSASGDVVVPFGVGDSLTEGQANTISNIGTAGSHMRALHNANGDANPIAGMTAAFSGSTTTWLASAGGLAMIAALGPMATHLDFGFGANFWLTTPGTALALVQASVNSIWAAWYASDVTKRNPSILARLLTPRMSYTHAVTSATNVTTTATITSTDGLVPVNGSTVVHAGFTPAAYNGTFTVTGVSGNTYTVTLLSDPGGSSTVQGTWTDNGVNSSSVGYLNNCWAPIGTAPLGNARLYNDWLLTQVGGAGKLLSVEYLATNRVSAIETADGFLQITGSNPSLLSLDGTHWTDTGWDNERVDLRALYTALV